MGFFEIFAGVLAALYAVVGSFGLSIILLTLIVRIILLPLSIKQTRSMREMQRIQPEIKKLQQKYKNNRQKLNEEMMALYKEHGVNPLGGCLPLVMQFPVFIALYRVVREPLAYMGYHLTSGGNATNPQDFASNPGLSGPMQSLHDSELANQILHHTQSAFSFLWGVFHLDCTPIEVFHTNSQAPTYCASTNVLVWIPYVLLILLMGATTYWQQRQLQGSRPGTDMTAQQKQMQTMTRIMPAVLMFFSLQFPTGLTLYWLTSNVWTVFQQRKVLGPMIASDEERADKGAAKQAKSKEGAGQPSGKGKAAPKAAPAGQARPTGKKTTQTGGKKTTQKAKATSGSTGNPRSGKKQSKQSSGSAKKKRK